MKHVAFAVMVLCLFLSACKKDTAPAKTTPPPSNTLEKFPVKFSVADFLTKLEPMPGSRKAGSANGQRDTALAGKISLLQYMIYNEIHELVKRVNQRSTDSSFGTYVDRLPTGFYVMSVILSTDTVTASGVFWNDQAISLVRLFEPFMNYKCPLNL